MGAGDSGAGAGLMHLSDIIAGKPAPTGLMQLLWGAAVGDSGAGAGLMHHSDIIAGKPAPTGLMQLLWGLAVGDTRRFDAVVVGAGLPAIGHWRSGEISVFAQSAT